MTPDTTAFMLAGFIVIVAGIVGYALSLVLRNRSLDRKNRH